MKPIINMIYEMLLILIQCAIFICIYVRKLTYGLHEFIYVLFSPTHLYISEISELQKFSVTLQPL